MSSYYWFSYDIPVNARIQNPTRRLRRIGARLNFSVWILPESSIPYGLIDRLHQVGANTQLVRFDPSEADKLLEMAKAAIEKEIQTTLARAQESQDAAHTRMYTSDKKENIALQTYLSRSRFNLKRANDLLADLRQAAAAFGTSAHHANSLDTALNAVNALQTATHKRASAYAALAATAERLGERWAAKQAADDAFPALFLCEYIEERGADQAAVEAIETVRAAFTPSTVTETTEVVVA